MRIRTLLLVPTLATVALGIGASGASAATLFTTTAHTTRVTVGATSSATSEGPLVFTSTLGQVLNVCNHMTLHVRVVENSETRSSLDVYSSTMGTCDPFPKEGVHVPPWRLTVTGNGSMIGGSQAYPAALHNVNFLLTGLDSFRGNLANLTVTQPTVATSPICVDANNAAGVSGVLTGVQTLIDAKFCLTSGAGAAWSLT